MNFLKDIYSDRRLYLQLKAFQDTAHLRLIDSLVGKSSFELEQINTDTLDLSSLDFSKHLRLGNRLELFFEFLLNQSRNHKILEKNIQIVENKVTIGELDFVIENTETKTLIHIEMATKFYLYDEQLKEWIGPNRNDSLFEKANKLKSKQFPLLFQNRTKEILNERNVSLENVKQNIHFKTLLFVPLFFDIHSLETNLETNIKGAYLYKNQFEALENKPYKYFIPEKQDWLVEPKYGEVWFPFKTVLQSIHLHFKDCKNPLVWIKKSDTEFEKVFVVDW